MVPEAEAGSRRHQRGGALAAQNGRLCARVLSLAMLWRLFRYEAVDFSLMLVVVGAISGVIWLLDRPSSRAAARAAPPRRHTARPRARTIAVEYARSFFPVIVLVLVIRSFLFEPFRIPPIP